MSFTRTMSIKSTTSTSTMTTIPSSDLVNHSANDLYDDREHFQAIFSNDSRFFDTSLHLFKSYCALGYIQSDNEKNSNSNNYGSSISSNKHRWRPRLLPSLLHHHHHHNEQHTGIFKAFLTPTLLRKSAPTNINRSDSGISTTEPTNQSGKSPMIVRYQQLSIPTINITNDQDSEVTITRL